MVDGGGSVRCPSCGGHVPSLEHCVRCGREVATARRGYSAAPEERSYVPRIVSTLFPQLPSARMAAFRFALFAGFAAVAGFTIAGLYPIAIWFSALSVPTLTALYLYDVDVYEDSPGIVYGLTVVWGVAMGAVVALVGRALVPSGAEIVTQTVLNAIVTQGIVLPLLGLALGLAGPLTLLPYHRFNDVLDGITFGAVSAAWVFAAQLLLQAASLFDGGLRPGGALGTWFLRLVQLAVAGPLLWASIGGVVAGTLWLRYRADASRPRRWSPWLVLVAAPVFVVVPALAHLLLALWAAVIVSLVATAVGLLWLRRLIHFALVAEAGAIEIGPEITCANCGERTPRHAFCGSCGVAQRALPKAREAPTERFGAGWAPARLGDRLVLSAFGLALFVVGVAASTLLLVYAPEATARRCSPGEPCGGPPSASPRLARDFSWRSASGVALAFDAGRWLIQDTRSDQLRLRSSSGNVLVVLRVGRDLGSGDAQADLPRWIRVSKRIEDLPIPHGPNLGYVNGEGAWYEGLVDAPQGPRESVTVARLAAERAGTKVRLTAVFFLSRYQVFSGRERALREAIDSVLNTVVWPGRVTPETGATSVRGLRPIDVARAYGIEPLWRRGIRGRGETVAVISMDTFREEDIAEYERSVGITGAPPVERVQVLDEPVELGSGSPLESALDIEIIRAVAPEAAILNYEAPLTWDGFVAALKKINDDARASIVSISWGKCFSAVAPEVRAAMERELDRAKRNGISVFVASGDSGAFSCLHTESESDERWHQEIVDWPAASPSVVAVGGTRLSIREDGTYFSEDAWEDTLSNRGAGGGVSPTDTRPAWQRGRGVENGFSNGKRQVPDVAGPSDCDSAFFVVYPQRSADGWEQRRGPDGCGTSAAAPFWAGAAALIRQYARSRRAPELGFLAPLLYDISRSSYSRTFHDVQTGGNLEHDAERGWDFATGLGSPDVWNLARAAVDLSRGRPRTR